MNREEALSIWAPPDSPWSRWTIAVLFGFMPDDLPELGSAVSELARVPFIAKPLHAEEVLARVRAHLQIRSLQQVLAEQNALLQTAMARRLEAEAQL